MLYWNDKSGRMLILAKMTNNPMFRFGNFKYGARSSAFWAFGIRFSAFWAFGMPIHREIITFNCLESKTK